MTIENVKPTQQNIPLANNWNQLLEVLIGCFADGINGSLTPQQVAELIHTNSLDSGKTLLENLSAALHQNTAELTPESFALVVFADQLFANFQKNNKLHPSIQPLLSCFRIPILLSLCRQQLPWLDEQSPLRHLSLLLPNMIGWQPEIGRAAEKFTQSIEPLLATLTRPETEAQAWPALQQFLDNERQRIEKLERRLRDAEIGQLQTRHAQQLSAKTLNQQMAGKKLPSSISHFLQGPWLESLRLVILSHGQNSEQWRKIARLTETLIWSFQPVDAESDPERHQHIYQSISELSEELRDTTVGLHHSNELDEQLERVEAEHLKILRGQKLEYAPFELIQNTSSLINAQVSVSNSLIKNVDSLQEGQWFLYKTEQSEKRIKLTIKMDQAQQLLFTNFIGIKSEQFNFEEFAYLLSSKVVIPLATQDRLKATGEKMLQSLLNRYQQKQEDRAEQQAREQELHRQQELARQQAQQKALEEAKAHAAAAAKARQQAEQEAEQLKQQQHQNQILAQLKKLTQGGRVFFIDSDGSQQLCRVAAILQSSGDYIFVDRDGIKKYSLNREQLTERLLSGTARIVDQGSNFDSTLEQVVNNLRTRKKD